MKKITIIFVLIFALTNVLQARKTRSDKGGHHKHSSSYYLKHSFGGSVKSKSKHTSNSHSSSVSAIDSSANVIQSQINDMLKESAVTTPDDTMNKFKKIGVPIIGLIFYLPVLLSCFFRGISSYVNYKRAQKIIMNK